MEGLTIAFEALTPLHIFLAILGGVVFGVAFKHYWLHMRTIYFMLLFLTAFSIGRLIFVGAANSATGTGILGTILFIIYTITTIIVRRIARRGQNPRDDY